MPVPDAPLVSILTPSFNQGAWLADNLRSVAIQTYAPIQHIVVDGGSTDGSLEVLEAAGDSVAWHSEPDEGQADALNKAFGRSSGEIIGWLNSDDAYVDARVVADVVSYFQRHPHVDVVYGHSLQVTGAGLVIRTLWAPPCAATLLKTFNPINQPSAFIRRSALTEPLLDASYHFNMDWELWLRLARAHRFARMRRILAIDRHHPARKSELLLGVFEEETLRLSEAYGQHYPAMWELWKYLIHVVRQFAGIALIPRIPDELAFDAPGDATRGIWRRHLSRRRNWPEAYK